MTESNGEDGPLRVLQAGLGPIGRRCARNVLAREGLELVAAVDPADDIQGRDLGRVCELERDLGIVVAPTFAEALEAGRPNAALLTTTSSLEKTAPQIEELVAAGVPVVSTCEELSYPWDERPELAQRLDEAARAGGAAVLGTGVNPGYLMDFLPLALTAVCETVERVKVWRIQDASVRRVPFQQKIGAALTLEQFEEKRQTGSLRHVGLAESVWMIAAALGWELERVEDVLTPVVAEEDVAGGYRPIAKGMARGVQQVGKGWRNGEEVITLIFRAAVGEPDPRDTVRIEGTPTFESTIAGGMHGDVATCAIAVNALRTVVAAPPGLLTMADVPPVTCAPCN